MMGPQLGSSSIPGFLNTTRGLLSSAANAHAYISHPCTLYSVCRSIVCDAGGTDTFRDSSCAHVRAAPKVMEYVEPFSTFVSWLISASLPRRAACVPWGTMRIIRPCCWPDSTSSTVPLDFQPGIKVGPPTTPSVGKPFDGDVSKSPLISNPAIFI